MNQSVEGEAVVVTKPLRFLGALRAEGGRALGLGRQYVRKRRAEMG